MASSLFQQNQQNPLKIINQLKSILNGRDPNVMFNMLLHSNPQFANFIVQNKNKTPEQIAKNYGIDFNAIMQHLK